MPRPVRVVLFVLVLVALWTVASAGWPFDELPDLPFGLKYPWGV